MSSCFLNITILHEDNINMSVQKPLGKMSCQLWYILLSIHNLHFKAIMSMDVQMHNVSTPDGNLEIYAWAEDIWNTSLTAHLEFKEHIDFFFPYNETHFFCKGVFCLRFIKWDCSNTSLKWCCDLVCSLSTTVLKN